MQDVEMIEMSSHAQLMLKWRQKWRENKLKDVKVYRKTEASNKRGEIQKYVMRENIKLL